MSHQSKVSFNGLYRNVYNGTAGLNEPVVKSEAALGTMEPELSRDVLPCLDGFTLVVGADGEIVYTSGNIQQLMGLTVEEVVGHQLVDFIHPCDQVMR